MNYYKKSALPWLSVYLARRLCLALIVVLIDSPLLQLLLTLITQYLVTQFLVSIAPMMDTVDQLAHLFNEVCITTTTVLMFYLTDITTDNNARYEYGWVLVGMAYFSVAGNLIFIGVKFIFFLQYFLKVRKVRVELRRRSRFARAYNKALIVIGGN